MLSRSSACVLVVLCCASSAAAKGPFQWDVPEVVDVTELAGGVKVDGVPVGMQVVVSRWPIDALIQHFATKFDEAGFFMAKRQRSPAPQPILTAYDPRSETTYSVIFDRGPGPHTTLVLGVARWSRKDSTRRDDFAPVFPGASAVVRSEDEGARVLSFQAQAKPAELQDYYRSVLTAAGYAQQTPDHFQKGDVEILLAVRPVDAERTHVMLFGRRGVAAAAVASESLDARR